MKRKRLYQILAPVAFLQQRFKWLQMSFIAMTFKALQLQTIFTLRAAINISSMI